MADGQVVVLRAKYKTHQKAPGVPGVLKLTEENFEFVPNDPSSSEKLQVGFRSIKGHRSSKEDPKKPAMLNLIPDSETKGGGYYFEFEKYPERDVCREFVGYVLGKYTDSAKPKIEGHNVKPSIEQLSKEEVERRVNLLREDRGFTSNLL